MKPLTFFRLKTREEVLALYQRFSPVAPEEVGLLDAVGRIAAAPLSALEDVPPFPRATMDGYAVRAQDTFGASPGLPQYLAIKGDVAMGAAPDQAVGPGEALRLPTGGMLPQGADAVVMVEYTAEHPDQTLEVRRAVAPGENILQPGEDVRQGEVLFPEGWRLRPQDVGLLAALGVISISVYRRPLVAIISSGDEIVPVSQTPGLAQVRDSNAYLLAAQVEESGGAPSLWGIIPDDYHALRSTLAGALEETDLVLISGGSSVGTRDLTLAAIQDLPGAEILVHGVSIRPGKPTILAAVGAKPLLGLPGHPASAAVVMHVLGRPLLARLAGPIDITTPLRTTITAQLSRNLAGATGREDFVRVRLRQEEDILWADPVLGPSGLLSPMVKSDGLVMIPLGVEGLNRNEIVTVQLFER